MGRKVVLRVGCVLSMRPIPNEISVPRDSVVRSEMLGSDVACAAQLSCWILSYPVFSDCPAVVYESAASNCRDLVRNAGSRPV